ncbi:hypothetical protein QUA84_25020, partial [Microcoleus sp. F8-C3]
MGASSSELLEVTSVSVLAGSDVAGAVTTGVSDFGTSETIAPASPVTLDEDSVVTTDCSDDTG